MSRSSIALILLAAGASTRMGTSKQLLTVRGRSLLCHSAETALASVCRPVIVVLGAEADAHRAELAGLAVETIDNPEWSQGMGTSIRAGMRALPSDADAVVIMLCDQPHVTAELLDRLAHGVADIVACEYGGSVGVPAKFAPSFFDALRALQAQAGAKKLIQQHRDSVLAIPFPAGTVDIDTPADYQQLGKLGKP